MSAAAKNDSRQWVQAELSKRVLKASYRTKKGLKETILEFLA